MQRQKVDKLVQMLFLGVFGAVLAMILFCNRVFHYNRLLQLLGLAALAVCVCGALWLVDAKGLAPALLARRRQLLLCALVLFAYAALDMIVRNLSGNAEFKFVGEPVSFGLLYMLFDTALVSVKNIAARSLFGAKNKNV